jgi:hypothetical protein
MRLISYLYFLLRLEMSAVVTVLVVKISMLYTGIAAYNYSQIFKVTYVRD